MLKNDNTGLERSCDFGKGQSRFNAACSAETSIKPDKEVRTRISPDRTLPLVALCGAQYFIQFRV
jgi:hypothetical protein